VIKQNGSAKVGAAAAMSLRLAIFQQLIHSFVRCAPAPGANA
jgi:hypothetical protein